MSLKRLLHLVLPALIPSWRFFRAVAASPRIEVCLSGSEVWTEAMPRPDHVSPGQMARRLLWNPRWNEALYLVSLAERVVEVGSPHAMQELELRVARLHPGKPLQLRLVFVERDKTSPEGHLTREVLYQTAPFGGAG